MGGGSAVTVTWFYNDLTRRIELFELNAASAAAIAVRYLETHTAGGPNSDAISKVDTRPLFASGTTDWEATFDSHGVLLASVWLVWFYVIATVPWACLWSLRYGS